MIYKSSILLAIVVACSFLEETYGQLACYQCNSYLDGYRGRDCLDPMSPNVSYRVCPKGYVCSKVSYVTQKTFVTSRSCDPSPNTCNIIKKTLQYAYSDLSSFKCYTCNKNYCNSNSGATFGLSLIAFALTALAKLL